MTRTVWICNQSWTVELVDRDLFIDGSAVLGITDTNPMTMTVTTKNVAAAKVPRVLLHEMLHACLDSVANGFPVNEEQAVQAMEVGMYSVLTDRRNKWWLERILK